MTKIPSVEERVAKFQKEFWKISGKSAPDLDRKQDEYITQALTAERTALLTELREVIQAIDFYGWNEQTQSKIKEKVQAHINNLINPSNT